MEIREKGNPGTEPPAASTLYEALGGAEGGAVAAFHALVEAFYRGVEGDPLLRPMYPEDAAGMVEAREHLALFLIQYFGGPTHYNEKRGHPRLRMRHVPFAITPAARDAWLRHMDAAIDAVPEIQPVAPTLRAYFINAAHFLTNQP